MPWNTRDDSGWIRDKPVVRARPAYERVQVGQRVLVDVGDVGRTYGEVLSVEADRCAVRFNGGGWLWVSRAMLRTGRIAR